MPRLDLSGQLPRLVWAPCLLEHSWSPEAARHPPSQPCQTQASQAWPEVSSYSTCRWRPVARLGHLQVPAPRVLLGAALVSLGRPAPPPWGLRVAGRTSVLPGLAQWGVLAAHSGQLGLGCCQAVHWFCLCIPPCHPEWTRGLCLRSLPCLGAQFWLRSPCFPTSRMGPCICPSTRPFAHLPIVEELLRARSLAGHCRAE